MPLRQPGRYKGAKGGRGSGKSHFFADEVVTMGAELPWANGGEGLRAVCLREIQKDLRQSSKLLIEDKIRRRGFGPPGWKIFDKVIQTPGDGQLIFQGMQNHTADSVKSLEGFRLAWCEEAQNFSERSLTLLRPTIRAPESQLWFSWNPNDPEDPIEQLLVKSPPAGAIVVHANFEDNPWFPPDIRLEMEYDRDRDPEKYAHVWLGHYLSQSSAQVFKNWRIGQIEVPAGARPYYGADWGFSIDPTVLIRCWFIGARTLYIDREVYEVGCEIDNTPALFAGTDPSKTPRWENAFEYKGIEGAAEWPITADSARPETISYMQRRGFNITPALKGPSSLEDGIEFLKSYDIVVHEDCKHVIGELAHYAYKVDKRSEKVLPVLADKHNHTIDAVRYAVESVRRRESVYGSETGIGETAKTIPAIWTRVGAVTINSRRCAAVWIAYDRSSDVAHITDVYSAQRGPLAIHAETLRKRGKWVPVLMAQPEGRADQEEAERIAYAIADAGVDLMTVPFNLLAAVEAVSARVQPDACGCSTTWTNGSGNFGISAATTKARLSMSGRS
jgi:phage terminase large subunit